MTDHDLLCSPLHFSVQVTANDYAYEGFLVSVFYKRTGAIRCVIEDSNGRLFIHNAKQIEPIRL